MDSDPSFLAAERGDFRVASTSDAIGKAVADAPPIAFSGDTYPFDFDSSGLLRNSAPELGSFEYDPEPGPSAFLSALSSGFAVAAPSGN
jgi:hypothetical protein